MKERSLVKKASPCDDNLHNGGPQTLAEARSQGASMCPHYAECKSGIMHPKTGVQCVMQFGIQVARFVAEKEHRGGNVETEMGFLRDQLPRPKGGFLDSTDRVEFVTLTDRAEILAAVERFAREVLYGPEGTTDPRLKVGGTFGDVVAASTTPEGHIDLRAMDQLEGRFGSNGGRGCDVSSGPCSCGAWH